VLTSNPIAPERHIAQIVQLAQLNHLEGLRALEHREASLHDPFLRRAIGMIVDMRREEEILEVVEREFVLFANRYESSRQVLLTMGKLFPSFGMVGTLIGLVLLLHHASNPDPQTLIPALSVAVLTTLYGAVFGNAIATPLAAKLQAFIHDREMLLRLTAEGALLIARGQAPAIVQKRLMILSMHGELSPSRQLTVSGDRRNVAFSIR
jgi:chemotaxis protein MotA